MYIYIRDCIMDMRQVYEYSKDVVKATTEVQ